MISVLVMLNNYFHDFATALVVVTTFGMMCLIKRVEATGSRDSKELVVNLYPRMVHLAGGSVVFVFFAGIIRSFTYKQYEWHDAVASGQVTALIIKHIVLTFLFAYGIYLWLRVYRKIKSFREELR